MLESTVGRIIIKIFVRIAARGVMSVGDVIMPLVRALHVVILTTLLSSALLR